MKRAIAKTSFFLCLLLVFNLYCSAETDNELTSSDGKYGYYSDEDGIWFSGSTEPGITVLNIPEKIDGKKVTGTRRCTVNSNCVVKVNMPSSIKTVSQSFPLFSSLEQFIPLCNISFNNEITHFDTWAFSHARADKRYEIKSQLKVVVFPELTEKIGFSGFNISEVENIVFQKDYFTQSASISDNFYYEKSESDRAYSVNVYFVDKASNFSADTFDWLDPIDDELAVYYREANKPYPIKYHNNPNVTIYKKPGAEGFEKFEEAGYTVKEYTDEWWKDIKEIQSVEISGEGVTLKKYSKGKGTVTELGWSPSNDPAQYLSREYELSAKPGDSITLKSSFAPADAFDDRTFFVSLNEDVATVDTESGKVTVLKEGTATIRCVAASGVFSDCFIYSGSVAQTQAKTQAKSDSLKAKTPLIIISCSCAAVLVAGVVLLTIKKKRRKV